MEKQQDILGEVGLSNWESQLYNALLVLGETTTGPLVEKSGVPQSKIYGVLDKLREKGLVSYVIKGKMNYFQAESPEKILVLLSEKERGVKEEVRRLKQLEVQQKESVSVQIFEGLKAIRLINSEIVKNAKKGDSFYGYSSGIYPAYANELYHQFGELRRLQKIKDHLLISKDNKKVFEESIEEGIDYVKEKTRYSIASFPQDTAIFRGKVILYLWSEIPRAMVITGEQIAQQYKDFFLSLWKAAS